MQHKTKPLASAPRFSASDMAAASALRASEDHAGGRSDARYIRFVAMGPDNCDR